MEEASCSGRASFGQQMPYSGWQRLTNDSGHRKIAADAEWGVTDQAQMQVDSGDSERGLFLVNEAVKDGNVVITLSQ